MLRLLFDQHAGGEIRDRLVAGEAFDIELIRDAEQLGPRADDTEIWRYAVETGRVVFTNDEDFVDGTADPADGTHPGVIRFTGSDWDRIAGAVERIEQMMTAEEMAENAVVFHIPTGWIG